MLQPPPPAACSTETISICAANDATLLAGPHDTIRTVTTGDSRTSTYQCDNGTWRRIARSGYCTCTPGVENRNFPCANGFTGNYLETCTTVCPGREQTCTNDYATACTCVGYHEENVYSCAPGFTGEITSWRDFVCDSATTGYWTDYASVDTCTCTPETEEREVSCDGALTGTKWQTNNFECPSATWTGWVDDPSRNNCTCDPTVTTQHDPCPNPSDVGYVINEVRVSCPDGTTTVTQTGSTCAAPPPLICSWVSIGSERLETSRLGNRLGDSPCTCGQTGQCWRPSGSGYFISPCSCQ